MKMCKILHLAAIGAIVCSVLLSGCDARKSGGNAKPGAMATPVKSDMPDTSKAVKLKGYMMSTNAPKMWDEVQTEVNKLLSAKVNTTMEVNILPQGDAKTKIPMINASGEDYDFVYTANWLGTYSQEISKGAYQEITEDMIKKLMPKYYQAVNKANLNIMKVDGKLYCIPQTDNGLNFMGFMVRKDLREKYGLPAIKNMADMEKYLETVMKNEKGIIPFNLSKLEAATGLFDILIQESFGDRMMAFPGITTVNSPYEDPAGKVYSLLDKDYYEAFKKSVAKMKEFYDKGYVPKNPFGNTVQSADALVQGKSAIARTNLNGFAVNYSRAKGNNYDTEFYPMVSSKGNVLQDVAAQGAALKANGKNIERTLMAMDYIYQDPDIVEMLEYGIKGKSYVVTKDGKIDFPEGINSANAPYPQGIVSFWFTDSKLKKPMASWPQQRIDMGNEYSKKTVSPPLNGITLNTDSIKTEMASIKNIESVEGDSLKVGMVENVDAMMEAYLKKLKDAGYEKVVAEMKKQAEAFVKSK